jgi:hypothetical protein
MDKVKTAKPLPPLPFRVGLYDPGVFVFIDGKEAIYFDTSEEDLDEPGDGDRGDHGYGLAEILVTLYEKGPDACLEMLGMTRDDLKRQKDELWEERRRPASSTSFRAMHPECVVKLTAPKRSG